MSRSSFLSCVAVLATTSLLACSGSTGGDGSGTGSDSSVGGDSGAGGGDTNVSPDGGADTASPGDTATTTDSGSATDTASGGDTATSGDTSTTDDTGSATDSGTSTDTGFDAGCVAPRRTCGASCVDPTSDDANCGGCGIACTDGKHCTGGVCACGAGGITCGSKCVDPATDPLNCGGCGKACATGETCSSGTCGACPASKPVVCGAPPGACTDLSSDDGNCGGCGTTCTGGTHCVSGVCSCGTGLVKCGSACADLSTDPLNCGGCGVACGLGSCVSGSCVCGTGQIKCGTKCVDPSTDSSNCGGCGVVCTTGACSSGVCPGPTCHSAPPKVLFYGPTGSFESSYLPAGSSVTVADATTWAAMTTTDFKGYQLIIIGDVEAGGGGITTTASLWDAANANKATWSAAVDGRIVVSAQDPTYHAAISPVAGASVLLRAQLQWLATGPGTALYVGPNYGSRTNLDFLSAFGAWTSSNVSQNDVHIVDTTHPTMIGSTDATLSNWSISIHDAVTSFPAGFKAVTQETSVPGNSVEVVREVACVP